jgi:hypothetical protein
MPNTRPCVPVSQDPSTQAPPAPMPARAPRQPRHAHARAETGSKWRLSARALLAIAVPLLLVGVVAWPLLFSNATFNEDWLNHLWYIWHQSLTIQANHLPSFFINYSHGVFYPVYAFYGGTLYSLAGALSLALGDAPMQAYLLTYLLGFFAAYAGWYWLARMFGLGRWLAHTPAIVFVTSGYYLMMVYGIGDWPEFLAISAMPLMIAASLAIIRADRLRLGATLALMASTIIFFGSHLLTTIWGTTLLVVAGVMLLACVPAARRRMHWRSLLRLALVIIPAALVNAWFLVPTAAYQSKTVVASSYLNFVRLMKQDMFLVSVPNLFTLSHSRVPGTIVTTALPVLAMVWVLAGLGIALRARRRGTWMRVLLVLSAATTALLIMMTHSELILGLPRVYSTLQFSFRLESYVLLAIAGAVLAVLVLSRGDGRLSRLWTWLIVPILAVSVISAIQQTAGSLHRRDRELALSSYMTPTFEREGLVNYVDNRLRLFKTHLPHLTFPPESVHNDRSAILVQATPGQLVDSNLRSPPEFVHVSGAKIVGVDLEANDVLEIGAGAGVTPHARVGSGHAPLPVARITVSSADSLPILAGRLLTLLALAVLAFEILLLATPRSASRRMGSKLLSLTRRRSAEKAGHRQ